MPVHSRGMTVILDAQDLFAQADATHWQEKKKAAFVLQSTASTSKAGVKLRWQVIDLAKLKRLMKKPVLCDLRNIYNPEEAEAAGWKYVGVGKGRPNKAIRPKRPTMASAATSKKAAPKRGGKRA